MACCRIDWEECGFRTARSGEEQRLGRRLRAIWGPQLQAIGARLEGLRTGPTISVWLQLPAGSDPHSLARRLAARASRLLARDLGRSQAWPVVARVRLLSGFPERGVQVSPGSGT
ncbi:MAG: hypothetical protein KDC10_11695, partial [Calditrichaeota bacterium]|nr:hypothetical protein [Calditrichota bacterium]